MVVQKPANRISTMLLHSHVNAQQLVLDRPRKQQIAGWGMTQLLTK